MIDHLTIPVGDAEVSAAFYAAALAPLDMTEIARDGDAVGFGSDTWTFGVAPGAHAPIHIAFAARDRDAVRRFHEAACAAGGRCNGPPGLRPEYGANYFAAYVIDPDGNNIEAAVRA